MNKLDELIQELCPDGVEYKSFGDCAKIVRGASPRPIKNFITTEPDGVNWIKIGDVKPGEKYITSSAEKITLDGAKKSRPVKKGDFILSNSMSFGRPYILKIDGCVHDGWLAISEFSDSYVSDFLYYLLSSNMCQNQMKKKASFGGAVQNLNADIVRELSLPVPPLEVQQEIVYLLDDFTAKTAELQDKLNEELEARKKQYEYYRDSLFSDKLNDLSLELCPNGVQYCELKEIADISTGSHNTNEGVENGMYPFYVRSQEPLTLNSYDYDETAIITAGDGVGVGKVFHFVNGKYALHQRAYRIHANTTKVEDKFLYYYFCTNFMKYIEKTMFKGSVPSIRRPMLNAFKIPVPPLEIQQEIVRLLDDFTAKTTKLQDNLNEELEACKKQYEFYRDKLLTFKELNESEVN